jgi:hypothetical protein
VAVVHALSILLALLTLATLPCVVIFVLFADSFFNPLWHRAWHRSRGADVADVASVQAVVPAEPSGPPLEQIAADLHRLGDARLSFTPGSTRYNAATRAYDHWLTHACRALEIDQHLAEVENVDLDLERLRVEGQLIECGFVLSNDTSRSA